MKHKLRRIISLASVLLVGGCTLGMFAGCTTKHPEVTITYSFNGKDYAVRYTLSRNDAPKTVQHFLELVDAGFYDGMCIHDYKSDAMYSGGYYLKDGELEEVDYFTKVKELEEEKGITFTQSVWTADGNKTPLYTVYGEFYDNGVEHQYARENRHSRGALAMYYQQVQDTSKPTIEVTVERADGGASNDGNPLQEQPYYWNCATSLIYTFSATNYTLDNSYCVFGMANEKDYREKLEEGLFAAIAEYEEDLPEEESFTKETTEKLNQYDPFEEVRNAAITATYDTPVDRPIIIKSIKINKY